MGYYVWVRYNPYELTTNHQSEIPYSLIFYLVFSLLFLNRLAVIEIEFYTKLVVERNLLQTTRCNYYFMIYHFVEFHIVANSKRY